MTFLRGFFRNSTNKLLLALFIIGIIFVVKPFILPAKQCPDHFTQQQVDASNCIIGADIGSGLIAIFGLFLSALTGLILFVSLAMSYKNYGSQTSMKPLRLLLLIAAGLVAGFIAISIMLALLV